MNIPSRLHALRDQMTKAGVDAYILPSSDPHQSEYLPEYWASREWITGFNGSAGTCVVSMEHAGLWTDVRYFLQAEEQLTGTGITLHRMLVQTQAEYLDWLANHLSPGQTVGCDFWCLSFGQVAHFNKVLSSKGILLKDCGDLLTGIWQDRPALPKTPLFEHDIKYSGRSRTEKLSDVRSHLEKSGADCFLVAALDEIAYILNLRGSDVHCNPVFVAYLMIYKNEAKLFIDPDKVNSEIATSLVADEISIVSYFEIENTIRSLGDNKLLLDPISLNAKLALMIPEGKIVSGSSCIMTMKAIKNQVEIQHIRKVMEKDAVALVKAFMWLEKKLGSGVYPTEYEMAMQIKSCRASMPLYVNESFDAIIGYQSNGAIIHYRPDPNSSKTIRPEGILLLDSGGQYLDGTTDITRTIALSEVAEEIKKEYTAVLMGNIALSRQIFPRGTKGIQLDAFARQHLWQMGLNYGHGTGHGVGFFMNVHEPPQGFVSAWNQRGNTDLVEGMLTSNEPGFYKSGSHGIRIENLVLTQPHSNGDYGPFLALETMTLFPIDTSLIYQPDMDRVSLVWLNQYHQEVYNRVSPLLNEEERIWLQKKCQSIQ
ncbi:MAG: aminopeptidase P family protein [Saprospiraceae bacterium]|nr:aminopeptidase P family protein [Candidatus Vicinibacter affinis]